MSGHYGPNEAENLVEGKCAGILIRHDYIAALFAHAFSWSVFVMIPVAIPAFILDNIYLLYSLIQLLIFNTALHAWIDNIKCNEFKIKLWEDHVAQILITWSVAIAFL